MPDLTAIVVVDDDDGLSMGESLELLIKNGGWQPESFACARDFLSRPCPLCPTVRCPDFPAGLAAMASRSGLQAARRA